MTEIDKHIAVDDMSTQKEKFNKNIVSILSCAVSIYEFYTKNGMIDSESPDGNFIDFVYLANDADFIKLMDTYIGAWNNFISDEELVNTLTKKIDIDNFKSREYIRILANISILKQTGLVFKSIMEATISNDLRFRSEKEILVKKTMGLMAINYFIRCIDINKYDDLERLLMNISEENLNSGRRMKIYLQKIQIRI